MPVRRPIVISLAIALATGVPAVAHAGEGPEQRPQGTDVNVGVNGAGAPDSVEWTSKRELSRVSVFWTANVRAVVRENKNGYRLGTVTLWSETDNIARGIATLRIPAGRSGSSGGKIKLDVAGVAGLVAVIRTGSRPSLQLRNLPRESRRVRFSTGTSGLGRFVLRPARCKAGRTVLRSSWSMAYAAPDGGFDETAGGDTGRFSYRVARCNAPAPAVASAAT